jgi:SNF2 family DNA or RNA helicase
MRLDFMTSCKRFGICPKHRVSRGVALRPWQAQDMAWISSMLDSDVHYALLANDVGTGKTISALASLTGMVRNTQKLVAQGELRPED